MNIVFLPPRPASIRVYQQKKNPLNPLAHWVITSGDSAYPQIKLYDKKPDDDTVRQYIEAWFPEGNWVVTPDSCGFRFLVSPSPLGASNG